MWEGCIYIGVVYVIWLLGLWLIRRQGTEDADRIVSCIGGWKIVLGMGIGIYAREIWHTTGDFRLALVIVICLGCFSLAVFCDLAMQQVYRFIWYGVYVWCGIEGILRTISVQVTLADLWRSQGCDLVLFAFIQFIWFSHFYGRADCHGFFAGACMLSLFGGSLWDYLMQMVYAFGILFVIQFFHKNINRRGNLKEPVAFLPYVAAGLLIRLFMLYSKAFDT